MGKENQRSCVGISLEWYGKAVSKNRMHQPHPHKGSRRVVATPEYRKFVESMMLMWTGQRPKWPIDEPFDVAIGVSVGPRMDPQNVIDPVLDALEKARIVTKDWWLRSLVLRTFPRHKQGHEDVIRVVVATEPLLTDLPEPTKGAEDA